MLASDFGTFRSKTQHFPVEKNTQLCEPDDLVFEDGTFRPAAKITANGTYSIITDHLGTPVEMYDAHGERVWAAELDIYGDIRGIYLRGKRADCPFRYPGQYEDVETGLYYNRFRYYSPHEGMYTQQDPIGLLGQNPTLYTYVHDPNVWVDPFGLMPFWKPLKPTGMGHHPMPRTHANSLGFPLLGTKYSSPSWYPYELENSDILHEAMHEAVTNEGVPFNRKFQGTSEELIEKLNRAYSPFKQRGYLKIRDTGEILAKNITIKGALDKSLKWNKKQVKC